MITGLAQVGRTGTDLRQLSAMFGRHPLVSFPFWLSSWILALLRDWDLAVCTLGLYILGVVGGGYWLCRPIRRCILGLSHSAGGKKVSTNSELFALMGRGAWRGSAALCPLLSPGPPASISLPRLAPTRYARVPASHGGWLPLAHPRTALSWHQGQVAPDQRDTRAKGECIEFTDLAPPPIDGKVTWPLGWWAPATASCQLSALLWDCKSN